MRNLIYLLVFLLLSCAFVNGCKHTLDTSGSNYPRHVGDIAFDAGRDDATFRLCDENRAKQYYNFQKGLMFKGEKDDLDRYFKEHFQVQKKKKETGYITIRFVVNCEGKTGMFRVKGIDFDYKMKQFDSKMIEQLLLLTQKLDGWMIGEIDGKVYDYYQYLTFKIENGQLIEIMP